MSTYENSSDQLSFIVFQLHPNTSRRELKITLNDEIIVFSIKLPLHADTTSVVAIFISYEAEQSISQRSITFNPDSSNGETQSGVYYKGSGILSITAYSDEGMKVGASVEFSLPTYPEKIPEDALNDHNITKSMCAFLTADIRSWSSKGCNVQKVTDRNVTCVCTHLTSFMVIFEVSTLPVSV
ncbi:latrophilin Cirl-like [Anneissia japonica]|uniref:latrophilin Cirl-like n=1 Tax=Anneissia japonica TaxID=1529436 RepID=UPI0014258587|nr:latrophilin Cirl-like [Anneissia japonica]